MLQAFALRSTACIVENKYWSSEYGSWPWVKVDFEETKSRLGIGALQKPRD